MTVAAATDMAHTHTESAILTCDSYDTTLLQVVAKPCFGTAVNVAAITDEFHIGSEIISLVLGQYYTKPRMGSKHKIERNPSPWWTILLAWSPPSPPASPAPSPASSGSPPSWTCYPARQTPENKQILSRSCNKSLIMFC